MRYHHVAYNPVSINTMTSDAQSTQHILSLLLYRNQSLPIEQLSAQAVSAPDRLPRPLLYLSHIQKIDGYLA